MPGEKLDNLINTLKGMGSALLAYSGGADSTLLLKALQLSGIKALAVTAHSETTPEHDLMDAERMARETGIEHRVVRTPELEEENFASNPPERCFYCKDIRFGILKDIAEKEGYAFVMDGSNMDDRDDFRPGAKAGLLHNVKSPLLEFTKKDIRETSRALGLSTWDRPSSACLATRFPYGMRITGDNLKRVSKAEDFLRALGFRELRVRDHWGMARIEVPEVGMADILSNKETVAKHLRELGYAFVSVDLEGMRSGSMNRILG